jgi:hypothetical protein
MAQGGSIAKIILKGEALPPLGLAYSFSPADVNDGGLTVFYAKGTAGGACGVFAGGSQPVGPVVVDGMGTPAMYMCNSLAEAPLTNGGGGGGWVAFAANVGSAGGLRAIYVSTAPGSATKVVMQGDQTPLGVGTSFGAPTLLDFDDNGRVLFAADVNGISCSSPPCSGIFVATGGPPVYTITKVVLEGDTIPSGAGGGTVSALGDASMNNAGAVAFEASVSGGTCSLPPCSGIFVATGGPPVYTITKVVLEGDEWKLGVAYSPQKRFVDTFTSVSEPRVNDVGQVSYYATTAGGEEGYFLATPGSEYEQAKEAAKDDPSVLGVDGFACGFGPGGRHDVAGDGTIIIPGCGGDPIDGVLVFPYSHKLAIEGELIPGGTAGQTYQRFQTLPTFTLPARSESGEKVAFKATATASPTCSAPCEGVFGGTVVIVDADGDGLLDAWEQAGGWDYNNDGLVDLNLWNLGARPNHKDIFVEVDYMDCTVAGGDCGDNHNHKPTAGIIEDGVLGQTCDDGIDNGPDGLTDTADPDCAVVVAFDNAPVNNPDNTTGIHLHVLVDQALRHHRFMNFAGSLLEDPTAANPGPCNDGLDNGFDGQADGNDADCQGGLITEGGLGTCNDGNDNDGDHLVDFADPDCAPSDFDNVKSFGTAGDSKQTLAAKTRVFHYAIFAHSVYPDNTASPLWEDTISGYGEMPGNDFMVTLGEWAFTADEQEGTFMHELGHNLGLDHGGGDSMNYKPNYLSVMNYMFQMTNIVANRPLDYSRWVLPLPDNEDGQGANTCNDGLDNGGDGVCDVAGCLALLPDPDCAGALIEAPPVEDPGMNPGPCDDGIDNGQDGKTDALDSDCQSGLDEGRGVDSNMPPAGLVGLSTAYTYLRVDPNTQAADCPFATVAAVGDIDWDTNGTYTGISLGSANTGAGISDPDPGPAPPQNALCLNWTSILDGYNDWPNLMYVKGFALSPDFSVNDHFTPHPEPAQMAQPDTDTDGIADIADNCRNDANPGQEDSDGDHVGNICDNCPSLWNLSQADTDSDGDGDACDNCPAVSNPSQQNSDADSYGDACDNCPAVSNPDQQNSDADSYGDACDNCPAVSNPSQQNSDADSYGDACDNCPAVSNPSQQNSDADSYGDACDNCPEAANPDQADWDNDGVPGTQPPPYSTWGGDACDDSDSDSKSQGPGAGFFPDSSELFMGTDPADACADTYTFNDERGPAYSEPLSPWPPDFNDSGYTDIGDLVALAEHWTYLGNPYGIRYDLNANGFCDIGDLVGLATYWVGTGYNTCTVGMP